MPITGSPVRYEWNDGELIRFTGMKRHQFYIYTTLNRFFIKKGYWEKGTFVAEQDVQLSDIQMWRPDIAYFTIEEEKRMKDGEDVIPKFVIEVISETDQSYKVEEKLIEYFKAGVQVVWYIMPESKAVYVYTSRREVKICIEDDICSAKPVLPDFEISVDTIFEENYI